MKPISNARQADEYLNAFINLERGRDTFTKRIYRLDRMEFLLETFGHPERSFGIIHIAGSKGKGSTAVMAASVLEAAGHKVGLFTSPHILDVRERIRLNRQPIGLHLFISLCNRVKRTLDPITENGFPGGIRPTFFEIMTLLGFLAFREKKCRYAVLEVGLGGRLDATNVVTPVVSLLTFMELEHEDILGNTLEKITAEKCGIVKPGLPVYSSAQTLVARRTIEDAARGRGAPVEFVDDAVAVAVEHMTISRTRVALKLAGREPERISLAMAGEAQAENAALVYLAVSRLFPDIGRRAMKKGLARARLPGRMEIVRRRPLIVSDGAHTPGSVARTAALVDRLLPAPRVLLFAAIQGKKYAAMAAALAPLFEWIVVSTPGTFKKSEPHTVFEVFRSVHPRVEFREDPGEALREAMAKARSGRSILVTGSYYFIAEIEKALGRKIR
ncbi:MAG: bifunctional folylpolyglutamate synthase/dihydrofolate synthase [Spirochaetales bacterium]|nr:bifunctional folylpolyglutamate synthase/dihydrofolate synthase [Spirochaetales bacterium]